MATKESAVAETLNRAHAALLEDLQKLDDAASARADLCLAELRSCLGVTRTHIAEHFRVEEQDGYMDTVQRQQPRLTWTIHQLAVEHGELTHSLDALIAEATTATMLGDALREKVREWIGRLRLHEIRETDFVQDAVNLDIGVKD
jgi:hypothetical protein